MPLGSRGRAEIAFAVEDELSIEHEAAFANAGLQERLTIEQRAAVRYRSPDRPRFASASTSRPRRWHGRACGRRGTWPRAPRTAEHEISSVWLAERCPRSHPGRCTYTSTPRCWTSRSPPAGNGFSSLAAH
jgi:hypothetical protein